MKKERENRWANMRNLYLLPFALFSFTLCPFSEVVAAQPTSVVVMGISGLGVEERDWTEPYFPGGTPAVLSYLSKNIIYPAQAVTEKIEGRVLLQFVVNKRGRIKDVEVIKGAHPLLDAEAVRVLENMPRWVPGEKDGKPINVKYALPVTFKLNK